MEIKLTGYKIYQPIPVEGWDMIGVIERRLGDRGALARHRDTRIYAQLNAGVIRSLPQRGITDGLRSLGLYN